MRISDWSSDVCSSNLIHTVGQCTPPDFASAGAHWNPTHAQHGRDNPMGAHHGDLPNLVVEAGEIGRASIQLVGTPLAGDHGVLDADGAAFVIHAGDRKSTRLNSSHYCASRMPSSA